MSILVSYIIATRNRLPLLKITLKKLIDGLQQGEEIVVVDGNSTDGAKEYLQQLFNENKIHQFISEPDRNQAHAWNKAMLMAKGVLVKKIIDDDVHDYNAIRRCRDFMLANAGVDICISNNLDSTLDNPDNIAITGRLPQYRQWKAGHTKAFTFSDVSLLLRKSSLSMLGLYDTQFRMMDWEYALRASYLKLRIAYYTGYNSMAVSTPGNVTSTATKHVLQLEEKIGKLKYNYAGDKVDISLYSHIKITLGKWYYALITGKKMVAGLSSLPPDDELQAIYAIFYQKLDEHNQADNFDFIY